MKTLTVPSRRSLQLLALGAFAIGTDTFVISGVLPDLARDLHVSLSQAGLLVTAFALAYAIGAPVLATLTGRVERRRLLTLALATFTAANVLSAVAPTYAVLLVARLLAAGSAALYMPGAAAVAASVVEPERRGRAMATVLGGISVANAVGVPLGALVGSSLSWRATFLVVAAFGLLALAGVGRLLPAVAPARVAGLTDRLRLARDRQVWMTLAVTTLGLSGAFTVYTYIAPLLDDAAGIRGAGLSAMLAVFGLTAVAGTWLGGRLADAWPSGRVILFTLGLVVAAFGVLTALQVAQPAHAAGVGGALVVAVLWGLGGNGFAPAQQLRLLRATPQAGPLVLSLNSSAVYLGMAGAGAFGGALLDWRGVGALPPAAIALELVALALSGVAARAAGAAGARGDARATTPAGAPAAVPTGAAAQADGSTGETARAAA